MTGMLGTGGRSRGLAVLLMAVGLLAGQSASSQPQQGQGQGKQGKGKAANAKPNPNPNARKVGGLRVPVGAPPKKVKAHGDPLAKAALDPLDPDAPDAIFQLEMGTLRVEAEELFALHEW